MIDNVKVTNLEDVNVSSTKAPRNAEPKTTTKSKRKRSSSKKKNETKVKPKRNFPAVSLEKCLIVAYKIKELNGANPWGPTEVGNAVNIRAKDKLFYYTAASRDYGITIGTSSSQEISLTDLGRSIVFAPNAEEERVNKIKAFLNVEIFKSVLEYYDGNKLPDMQYLSNTLEEKFKLHPEFHEEFTKTFRENCNYLNILTGKPLDEKNASTNISSTTITYGEGKKGTKGKPKAFVIMPFTEKNESRSLGFFKEVLASLLVPSGVAAGFEVETASRQGSDVIQSTIINDLLDADLVIADLTDHNPNVLFELGLRMMADKPVALIRTKDTGKIFDVDNMLRVFEYNENLWKSTIELDTIALAEHFKGTWENRNSDQTYMKILKKGSKD